MKQDVSNDVTFLNIGNLPSNFFPYKGEFSEVNIRPFLVSELKLLSRAATLKDVTGVIKAVNMTIDVPVERLTIDDYFYILMWHKLHSYPKTPLSVAWECINKVPKNDEGFIVTDGTHTKIEPCKSPNAILVNQADIDIVFLEEEPVIGADFDYPRVNLLPELIAVRDEPDYKFIINALKWIKHGNSLQEKIEFLESMASTEHLAEAEILNKTVVHGVRQYVTIKCSSCGAKSRKGLVLDPVNFFRPCF